MSDIIQKNLSFIRSENPRLYEVLQAMNQQHLNLSQQLNANGTGQPQAPPAVNGVKVTGQNGMFNIAIKDENPIYRGISYFAEHSTDPAFSNPQTIHLGPSRNHTVFLGNQQLYWRVYSSYGSSPASVPAYHGSSVNPQPVNGGGAIGAPDTQASQGSGTGAPGQGLSGQGPIAFRSPNGVPPSR